MVFHFARRLVGSNRTPQSNRQLGLVLAFVAGATNAGGFLAVHQYTSHMTGIVSAMADHLVLADYGLVASGAGGLISFLAGAMVSAILINYARRRELQSLFALPLLLEAALLIVFGLLGDRLSRVEGPFVPATVMVLCFIMGLQNAMTSKVSGSAVRTTHVTGVITDLGIELGKLIYRNISTLPDASRVVADRDRLHFLAGLVSVFFLGGVVGAAGFKFIGFMATVPLALFVGALAAIPALDDILRLVRRP